MQASIILAIVGFSLLAIVAIIDKFIVTNDKVLPSVFVFYSTIIALPLVLAVPFISRPATSTVWLLVILAGSAYASALYAMYRGFRASEVSHVGPLIGATVPLFTLAISFFFLPETLTRLQLGAIALLVVGSFIISFEKSTRTHAWREGVVWGTIAGFLFALFFSSAKVVYSTVGFVSGAVLVFGMMGICGLLILFLTPDVRYAIEKKPSWFAKLFTKRPPVALMIINKTTAFVAVGLVQYAITIGSVTIVNALTGLQYALLVIFVALVSRFRPRLFKETYTKGEMAQEIIAVVCIAVGVGLLLV